MELKKPILIAGPCAAESQSQIQTTAQQLFDTQIPLSYFRAGVWKPRSNPKDFCGAGDDALQWLKEVKEQFHFPVCVEVARGEHVALCIQNGIDAIWIGARTTVNPFLVQEIADALKDQPITVFIKNPITPELKSWIGAIERIADAGVKEIIAIHRGFTIQHESVMRNSPSWEIPIALKTHYPDLKIICDASHITGNADYIPEISQLALDYGFDGLMIEVHHDPQNALSDVEQQITPQQFQHLINTLNFKSSITTSAENDLMIQRNKIGNIDTQISELLRKRMEVVDEIAQIKVANNLALLQPDQWKKVVEKYQKAALSDPDYQEFIRNFLDLLHQSSLHRQKK